MTQILRPLPYHPNPPHARPAKPVSTHHPGITIPGDLLDDSGLIPGRSSLHFAKSGNLAKQTTGLGLLGVDLRSRTHTATSESTRARQHALVIIAEIQKELSGGIGIDGRSTRLPLLRQQLDHDLKIFESHEMMQR